jgi:hypothetical protein
MPFLNITSNFRNLKFNSGRRYIPTTTPSFTTVLDLQSTLTTLQFGNDRPGYGSSGLPYIQTQIPDEPGSPGLYKPIFRPGSTGNPDYPIRGGDIDFQVGQETFTLSNKIDSIRIQKFFKDAPRGLSFINKQIGLQLTNPKIETGNVLFGLGQGAPFPGILENTRVYNQGRNTLAQVRVAGTGGHALRHGLVPFAAYQKHYYAMVNEQNVNNEKGTNRLVNLNALKMTTSVSPFVNSENVLDINLVNTLGISLNRNLLFQYLGGPGSTYGIGSTSIKRVVDTTQLGKTIKPLAGRNAMVYDKIKAQTINNITDGQATTNIQDFRNQLPNLKGKYTPWISGSVDHRIDSRFFVAVGDYKDKLNLLKPFLFNNSEAPWEINKTESDDLIKFVFEAISNDNPNQSIAIFFRAFLTAGITDNNSAKLNSVNYAGRGETFYTYQGFDRSISFSFRIAAGSKDELKPIYNRLNTLVSQVYPDYGPQSGFMRAPIVRVTIGDYLYRMPGFLENVNITVDNGTPWEINLDGDQAQLPQVIDVSVSFRPILDELPRRAKISSELSVDSDQFSTTFTTITTKDNPQLIANNNSVIDPSGEVSRTQNSVFKDPTLTAPSINSRIRATQAEIAKQSQADRIREEELNNADKVRGTTLSEIILGPRYKGR